MKIDMSPIGVFYTDEKNIPRHWSISEVEGRLEINPVYTEGLKDMAAGQKIIVLFYFHQSRKFEPEHVIQTPPHKPKPMGVFSICSPLRPNPIGLSVLTVLGVTKNIVSVKHADMLDGTPILDIKPHIIQKTECPGCSQGNG
ncbi:MAG: tRNA (N6-threonylcarbamoyladenosine(37)-N6)-methyltransferase TrmO [Desulfobacteraceae bacterium]|nr:MAG: tRNA (N6-threonylcarbamoyladenosine(37)-N6)-methyltransferase TrmO [Desulfobacteraceae bacterium]